MALLLVIFWLNLPLGYGFLVPIHHINVTGMTCSLRKWFLFFVGGKKFCTTIDTLTQREPDSMLAAMFSGRHTVCQDSDKVHASRLKTSKNWCIFIATACIILLILQRDAILWLSKKERARFSSSMK